MLLQTPGLTIDIHIKDSDGNETLTIGDMDRLLSVYDGYLDLSAGKIRIAGVRDDVGRWRRIVNDKL